MSESATPEQREAERYPQIVRAVRETPWAILPGTLATILDVVGRRIEGERFSEEQIKARVGGRSPSREVQVAGSVAILPIYGAIIPRATLFSEMSGGSAIETLQADFRAALNDEDVKAIVLDIDSPGGMTTGVQEFASELRAARGQKPIVAVANFRAASAAYHLASQADEIVVAPSGDVGSIGVFAAHEDVSAMQEKLGVKTTLIQAKDSPYKVEGSPLEPLSEEGAAAIQERVDEAYDIMVADVAKGRNVSVAAVKEGYGKGRMLSASKALAAGMVDRIDTAENVVSRLQNPSGRARVANGSGARRVTVEYIGTTTSTTIAEQQAMAAADRIDAAVEKLHERTFSDAVDEAHRAIEAVVNGAEALRALTGTKREQLAALMERGKELLATQEETRDESPSEAEIELELAAADFRLRGL